MGRSSAMVLETAPDWFGICSLVWPPLVQPVTVLLGPIFLLCDRAWLGRLYVTFSICSLPSCTLSTIVLLQALPKDSHIFEIFSLLIICCLKLALVGLTNVHIRNVEAVTDESYMDRSLSEFLDEILNDTFEQ